MKSPTKEVAMQSIGCYGGKLMKTPKAGFSANSDKAESMNRTLTNGIVFLLLAQFALSATGGDQKALIVNDTVWKDDRGEEILCQGGNLAKFGGTFYFYGWGDFPGDNRKDTITCYSSKNLASWKFENHIYTRDMTNLTLIVPDRLHVLHNAATKKYVMIGKHILPVFDPDIPGQPRVTGGVSFFTIDTPASNFTYLGHEMLPAGAPPGTDYHRDLAAFQDTDGKAYVVSAHDQHKPHGNFMITRLTADYLKVDQVVCEIPYPRHEAPYIIKLKGRYWLFVSGQGAGAWGGSPTYYATAANLAGPWSQFKAVTLSPASKKHFDCQNDFLFEVKGTSGSFVLWGADRWSQRTRIGVGKNVWLPLQWKGDEPLLKWHPTWNVDAAAGTWKPASESSQPSDQTTSADTAGLASSAHGALHPWEKVEIVLTAEKNYPNPYFDVDVWVDLAGPGFSNRCHGFWDGGKTYRVRVVATAPGEWNWRSGSNQDDAGLNGKSGSFHAVAWTEPEKQANPNRRGFIRRTPNNRALQYADGTPCFIVGDWMPAASTSRYRWRDEDTDYSVGTPEGGFKDWIKIRKRQGYNLQVVISSFPSWSFEDGHPQDLYDSAGVCLRLAWEHAGMNRPETMLNEEGERPFLFPGKSKGFEHVSPNFDRINPSYFRYLDKKLDYANAQGFVVFLETLRRDIMGAFKGYHHLTSTDPAKNAMFHYIRYIYNRYQANSVIFSPIHLDVYNAPLGAKDLRVPVDLHHAKYGRPPFGQPVSTCINRSTYERFGHTDKAPWLTVHTVGNSPRDHTASDLIETMWNLPNPIPIFNQEPYFVANDGALESWENRRTMYSCLLRGGLGGVVYEAHGQTRAVRETSLLPKGTHGLHPLMWVSVLWTNANETQHARTFMLTHGARYQELTPRKELLSPAWNSTRNWAYCMRTDDKTLFKLYFEKDMKESVSGALPNAMYKAQWFNPRTGAWSKAGDGALTADASSRIVLPARPTTNDDWALSLSRD